MLFHWPLTVSIISNINPRKSPLQILSFFKEAKIHSPLVVSWMQTISGILAILCKCGLSCRMHLDSSWSAISRKVQICGECLHGVWKEDWEIQSLLIKAFPSPYGLQQMDSCHAEHFTSPPL